ncbi:MAG: hypothetical protein AAB513_00015 [Patescibacteria group bacterium]
MEGELIDITGDLESKSNEPNISSTLSLLETLKGLDQEGQVGLISEIKLKILDLEEEQKNVPNAQNVRKALSELREHLKRLTN